MSANLVGFFSSRISGRLFGGGEGGNRSVRVGSRAAVISIAISVAVVTIAAAVTTGFQRSVSDKITLITGDASLTLGFRYGEGDGSVAYDSVLLSDIGALGFVESVYPETIISATVQDSTGGLQGLMLRGVDGKFPQERFSEYMTDGEFSLGRNADSVERVVMSERLARKAGAQVGEQFNITLFSTLPVTIPVVLSGTFATAMDEVDNSLGFVSLDFASSLSGFEEGNIGGYRVFTNKRMDGDRLMELLDEEVVIKGLRSTSSQEQYPQVYDWLSMLDNNVNLLVIIMLIVAGVNMVSAVLIVILEQTRTIGTLKSMGMQNNTMQRIFLLSSLRLSLKGFIWGLGIATILLTFQSLTGAIKLDAQSYMIESVPVSFDILKILLLNGILLLGIVVFTWLPTLLISRISPATTLKFS